MYNAKAFATSLLSHYNPDTVKDNRLFLPSVGYRSLIVIIFSSMLIYFSC